MAIYLDNNATTALHEDVLQAMLPYMGNMPGNPSSVHRFGRLQRDAIEHAREQVARLAGAQSARVVFTSGGTESNNLLMQGLVRAVSDMAVSRPGTVSAPLRIAISAIEHPSMLEPAGRLVKTGVGRLPVVVDYLPVDAQGKLDLNCAAERVNADTRLVSVMMANNETGVIQDIAAISAMLQPYDCLFHSDASQAAGKLKLDFDSSGLHAMTLSAHKFHGPTGAGALILDKAAPLSALQTGGSQEHGLRAGTENVPAIVGMGAAAQLAIDELEARSAHTLQLRTQLENGLKLYPSVHIFAEQAERLPNTVQFGVTGFDGETLLMQLDKRAIAVSSGSACTSGKTEPSHVHQAMGIDTALANSAIRVSFSKNNTATEVDAFVRALGEIIENNRQSSVMMAASI